MRIERVLEQLGAHGMHAFYCGILDPVRGYTRKRLEYRYYDQPSGMILLSRSDVTAIYREQQEHQSALKAALLRAQTDPLTGLLNYQGTLEHSADPLARHDGGAAFFFIDLDNFKVVNDTLGHSAGDELLRRVADILRRETCPGAVVGRVGGDEFVALLPGLTSVEAVTEQAQRLCDAIARLTDRDFSGLPISCSIGIALAPEEGTDYASLAYKADMRAYKAKFGGKNGYAF
jgi:diguanylate cyclase (GGDEF)-like protein